MFVILSPIPVSTFGLGGLSPAGEVAGGPLGRVAQRVSEEKK